MFKVAFEISEYNKAAAAGRVNGLTLINRRVMLQRLQFMGLRTNLE